MPHDEARGGARQRHQRRRPGDEAVLHRPHQVQRGEGAQAVVRGVAEGQHARLAHGEAEREREQRGDHHLDRGIDQVGREDQRQREHEPGEDQQAEPAGPGHWRSPKRPAGRISSTSSISKNGMLAATVESCSVKRPPTSRAQGPRPTRAKQVGERPVEADRERDEQADHQRGDQRALERAEPADHDHDEDQRAEIDRHVRAGREERPGDGARQPGQRRAGGEHAHEDDGQVVAERLDHDRPVGGGPHDDADAGARQQHVQHGEHDDRDAAHEQAVERVVRLVQRERGELHVGRHGVVDGEVAVEQLDQLLDDEGEAERQQQLVGVAVRVHAAQHVALDQHAAGRRR